MEHGGDRHCALGICIFIIVRNSLTEKHLTFYRQGKPSDASQTQATRGPTVSSISASARSAIIGQFIDHLKSVLEVIGSAIEAVFGVNGYVGVNGPFFFLFFDILEGVEAITQTYQAYELNQFVDSQWLNAFAVSLVFLNGILPLVIVHLACRKNRGYKRLAVVTVDLVLDLIYGELFPAIVLLPIMGKFNFRIGAFPPELSFDDVWATRAVAQTRHVLVTSYVDLATTLVPHVNFILCMHTLKSLLHDRRMARETLEQIQKELQKSSRHPSDHDTNHKKHSKPRRRMRINATKWSRVFHTFMIVWSCLVLAVHLHAQRYRHADSFPGCKMPLTPWQLQDSHRESCAVVYINCYGLNISGDATEVESVLSRFESNVLTKIVLAHCPALTIPRIVIELTQLTSIETFNCTLVSWPVEAAITDKTHPLMHHVFFFDTNMSTIPDALLHDELPFNLQYLAVYGSNLTQIPKAIGRAWGREEERPRHWQILAFIKTQIRTLPTTIRRLSVDVLQLLDNAINEFPRDVFASMDCCRKIRLSGSAWQVLPHNVQLADPLPRRLQHLFVERTNVSELPQWLLEWLDAGLVPTHATRRALPPRRITFHESPLCGRAIYANYSRFCEPDVAFDIDVYPYDVIAVQRPLSLG